MPLRTDLSAASAAGHRIGEEVRRFCFGNEVQRNEGEWLEVGCTVRDILRLLLETEGVSRVRLGTEGGTGCWLQVPPIDVALRSHFGAGRGGANTVSQGGREANHGAMSLGRDWPDGLTLGLARAQRLLLYPSYGLGCADIAVPLDAVGVISIAAFSFILALDPPIVKSHFEVRLCPCYRVVGGRLRGVVPTLL